MKNSKDQILEHIIRRMQSDVAIDAPADAVHYSKNLFRTRAAQPKESVLRRVLAVMRVDLTPGTAAFGERSGGEGQARQLLFDCGENAVDLRIRKDDEKFTIRCQILGYGFENATVELASAGRTYSAKMDDVNEFRIEDVEAGDYSMIVRGSQDEILIDSVPVN